MEKLKKVISLELAQQIHTEHMRLEINSLESEWWWVEKENGSDYVSYDLELKGNYANDYPAYDVAELGEMLQSRYYSMPTWDEDDKQWHIIINLGRIAEVELEAEARGKMYLWLLKENYIKAGKNEN